MAAVSETTLNSLSKNLAKPLHIQRLEQAVRVEPFLEFVGKVFNSASTDADTSENESENVCSIVPDGKKDVKIVNGLISTKQERKSDRTLLYNFSKVKKSRKWLKNILLSDSSDSSSDEDEEDMSDSEVQEMLKIHQLMKQYRIEFHSDKELQQYQYYSVGLLSNHDKFYEHQKLVVGTKKKNKEKKMEQRKIKAKLKKIKMKERRMQESMKEEDLENHLADSQSQNSADMQLDDSIGEVFIPKPSKRKSAVVNEVTLALKRKKLWVALAKKEIPKAQKQKVSAHKEMLTNCKKMAQSCQKEIRKAAIQSQKLLKETPSRAKRLTREMLLYWKRYEKVEKEHRKKAEKEAQEQLKMDIELREAKRQQRKLNFLITQTELYAHFMSRKMGISKESFQDRILSQLDDESGGKSSESGMLLDVEGDDYDSESMKSQALKNVQDAYRAQHAKTKSFDSEVSHSVKTKRKDDFQDFRLTDPSISTDQDRPQPKIFEGKLKTYQLKGMNWLANLYDQGLNGILADEMGLGKTVQSIAFLAHIAVSQGIWGPFLIIAPASTLHNWQQEFSRFVSKFKVVPYWGNTNDRKILRKFWTQKDLHTEDASFHVLVTSYQLVVQDVKYFQRIKWQYMVLDEAQAIKSSSSVRWKILLGFNCRNRLLLTGTPIQNSMAELWALLHFIMPTLFDSHEEFNEWFSKDIESHAENKSTIDEKHLSRLHLILKPFMLRRIKKDVENELSDKIEILVYCQLTTRQKHLYEGLKKKISIDDLLHSSSSSASSQAQTATSSLMNLVMQFRKVCNHPELFERREVKSPFFFHPESYIMSKLVFRNGLLPVALPSKKKLFQNMFNIFHQYHVHYSLFSHSDDTYVKSGFSFTRFIDLSPAELANMMLSCMLTIWLYILNDWESSHIDYHNYIWEAQNKHRWKTFRMLLLSPSFNLSFPSVCSSSVLSDLVFTSYTSTVYTHTKHVYHCMPETAEHREMRIKKNAIAKSALLMPKSTTIGNGMNKSPSKVASSPKKLQSPPHKSESLPVHLFIERSPKVLLLQQTRMPYFLSYICPKVAMSPRECYCSDRSAAWCQTQFRLGGTPSNFQTLIYGSPQNAINYVKSRHYFTPPAIGGFIASRPPHGWSLTVIPDKETLVTDSGKLNVLDNLLSKLKSQGHRVLIYSQMTRMIDLLEEYMWHRKHTYMRLDGSSKISDRRDMVADFQTRSDIFVFLLSTRAGGLGINLTAADTVVFYDSDWNPTVDQQAMDRAHRLGQTKQVTVYRLICKGTIEERILQRAREKSEIQHMVISGGNFKPDTLKPKEVVSLLLDDDELERKFRQRQAERRQQEDQSKDKDRKRKRDKNIDKIKESISKHRKVEENIPNIGLNLNVNTQDTESVVSMDSFPTSPNASEKSYSSMQAPQDDTSNEGSLIVDDGSPSAVSLQINGGNGGDVHFTGQIKTKTKPARGTGRGRGRPKGSGKRGGRGRGATLAAAEIAGAQAGLSAAYAAYGYSLQGNTGSPSLRGSSLGRGHRPLLRGSQNLSPRSPANQGQRMAFHSSTSLQSSQQPSGNVTSSNHPPVMGFYTQGPDV
uniref:Chromatin-remodeling ATPase INO80 n=1 Tax=Hemiscolopendra marginata TaxID=943146 RepID=A0A646QDS9_9MYRI